MVKLAIIGVGNMGSEHAFNITDGKVPGLELCAICDHSKERLDWAKKQFGDKITYYLSTDELFANADKYDMVLIAVPHYDHSPLAIKAFDCGLHVLTEKPAGVYTKQVRAMNEAAAKSDKLFGIMYNCRTIPSYQKARQLIQSGELGELKRMVWIITNWYRPQAYHDSSTWRSTWKGEGGGVLLNQDPHQLDLWQWLCGMPKKIRAFASFGKYYNIEVEDDVTIYAEYENGMTASFITGTGEAPGTNRLEISGTRGKIVIENNLDLKFYRTVVDEREFNKTNKSPFGSPEVWECKVDYEASWGEQHIGILKNFVKAIEKGTPLLAPGEEGIFGLSISNAAHLSAWTDQWVEPMNIDEDKFYNMLMDKINNSTFKKEEKATVYEDIRETHV